MGLDNCTSTEEEGCFSPHTPQRKKIPSTFPGWGCKCGGQRKGLSSIFNILPALSGLSSSRYL